MVISQTAVRRLSSYGRGAIGLASSASGGIGLASPARGGIGLASPARGGIGLASPARGGIGLASYSRGGIGLAPYARGGIGLASPPLGGTGSFPAAGSFRGFSSSSFQWNSWESYKAYIPAKGTMKFCGLVGGFSGVLYCVGSGYSWLLEQSVVTANKYVDTRLEDFKAFNNVVTGVHHDFVRKYNEDTHQMQREIAELRSRMLASEQKEFDHRKELLLAAEVLRKHQAEQDAAAAKDPSQ